MLDPNGMDSGLELSPHIADSRRESFAVGPPLFSPKTEDWQSVDMQSVPSNNPFRFDQTQTGVFSQGNPWGVNQASSSGSQTPLQQFDNLPADFDPNTSIFQRSMIGPTPFPNVGNVFATLGGEQSLPTSPQKEWMMSAAHTNVKKMRPGSPSFRSYNELRRGDGIRKKNARFEIPPERTLNNIDQLIAQSTDEQEIKELKQQKRLLRNRQAALDSRQRKKMHTERLEDEKKQYTTIISDLEDEIANLKLAVDQLHHENEKYAHHVDGLTMEKDEMIRTHTIETGELRKKVGILTEHVQRLELTPMSGTADGTGNFSSSYDHMEDMNMAGAWDASSFLNDYPVVAEQTPEVKQEMTATPAKKMDDAFTIEGEKGASQGGLLFMLFLVGAFVMSNRTTPALPQVSDDVRAASATLLNNVLKDAGVSAPSHGMPALVSHPSGTGWAGAVPSLTANGMVLDNVAPSMLTELGNSLTQATAQQNNEQAFSLSADQYNGVSDSDFMQISNQPDRVMSQGRKNLAEELATLRTTNKQIGAAEVYTRSLLWDQIPSEVVRNFAKMVAECNNAQNEQQCNDAR